MAGFRDHDELATQWQRGLGLFSFTGLEIEPVDGADHRLSFRRYRARHGGLEFQIVGLWTWFMKERENHYKQAIQGAFHHADWLLGAPTVVLGTPPNKRAGGRLVSELGRLCARACVRGRGR